MFQIKFQGKQDPSKVEWRTHLSTADQLALFLKHTHINTLIVAVFGKRVGDV